MVIFKIKIVKAAQRLQIVLPKIGSLVWLIFRYSRKVSLLSCLRALQSGYLLVELLIELFKSVGENFSDINFIEGTFLCIPRVIFDFLHRNSSVRVKLSHLFEQVFEVRAEEL